MASFAFFPAVYALARRAGVLEHPWFDRLYVSSYFAYKRYLEDPFHALVETHPELFRGGHILDVGGNIGYNACLFADALDPGAKVFTFEPEEANFEMLTRIIAERGMGDRIVATRSAVGTRDGVLPLWLNQDHRADHRIATEAFQRSAARETVNVPVCSIDTFVAALPTPREIAFAKIDVQGYEIPVVEGMRQTIHANPRLTIAFEFAPEQTHDLGYDPAKLLALFRDSGHSLYRLDRGGALKRVSGSAGTEIAAPRGYVDLVATTRLLE